MITTGTLLGSGILTLLVGLHAWRLRFRALLLFAAALMTGTGADFAMFTQFWPLFVIAVVGTPIEDQRRGNSRTESLGKTPNGVSKALAVGDELRL